MNVNLRVVFESMTQFVFSFVSDYHRRDSCFDPATKKEYPSGSQWNRNVCTQCTCIQGIFSTLDERDQVAEHRA